MKIVLALIVAALLMGCASGKTDAATAGKGNETKTNVCVLYYSLEGFASGGIAVVSPNHVTYHYVDSTKSKDGKVSAYLTISYLGIKKLAVDLLYIENLPPGETCLGVS